TGEVPAALAEHPGEPGEEREGVVELRRRRGLLPGAEHEVLADGQGREDLTPLGDVADPEPGALVGAAARAVHAAEPDSARAWHVEPDDRLEQGRLPH